MKDEILPIGSVVQVNNTDIMICSYFRKNTPIDGVQYDYAGCLYPYGLNKDAILIKKEAINRVIFIGYQNGAFIEYKKELNGDNNE